MDFLLLIKEQVRSNNLGLTNLEDKFCTSLKPASSARLNYKSYLAGTFQCKMPLDQLLVEIPDVETGNKVFIRFVIQPNVCVRDAAFYRNFPDGLVQPVPGTQITRYEVSISDAQVGANFVDRGDGEYCIRDIVVNEPIDIYLRGGHGHP
jgi:hypothetical protein